MRTLYLVLLSLLSVQANESWKSKRGTSPRHSRREAPSDFPGLSAEGGGLTGADIGPTGSTGTGAGAGFTGPVHNGPGHHTSESDPVGLEAIRNFANGAMAAIDTYGPGNIPKISSPTGAVTIGGFRVPGPVSGTAVGHHNANGGGGYDFLSAMGVPPAEGHSGGPLLGAQNLPPHTNIDHIINNDGATPNVFNYQPHFGGRDYNNLPHILPPGGKSIQQLQEEADVQLRAIIAKAHEKQHQTLQRIERLKTQYGTGTIGFNGWTDMRFKMPESIDLGTHQARDLGTSIDVTKFQTADGKLQLPVQNIHHTKTVGIKIPIPYPVRQEVAVKVPVPVPVPTAPTREYLPSPVLNVPAQPSREYGPSLATNYRGTSGQTTFQGNSNLIDYDDDDDSSEEYQTSNGRSTYTIQPSRTINLGAGSVPRLPLESSYGPPAAGPVGQLTSFAGNVALNSHFPPNMNIAQIMQQISRPNRQYLPG